MIRLDREGLPVRGLRRREILPVGVENAQAHVSARPVVDRSLLLYELLLRPVEGRLLFRAELLRRNVGQDSQRLGPYRSRRITEHLAGQLQPLSCLYPAESRQAGLPDQGAGVLQSAEQALHGFLRRLRLQHPHRGCADDRGLIQVAPELDDPGQVSRQPAVAPVQDFSVVRGFHPFRIPSGKGLRGLFPREVLMAYVACVRRIEFKRKIRSRDTNAVIPAGIHAHVGLYRHVTLDALGTRGFRLVVMVRGVVVDTAVVAAQAERVTRCMQAGRVHIVTVLAGHALLVHLALDKGSVDVDFLLDLAVMVVQPLLEHGGFMRIQKGLAVQEVTRDQAPV